MNLLDSLLDAIVRLNGDALVMHAGEKPYVVTTSEATDEFRGPLAWGQVELSSRVLTIEAVNGMLGQVLPIDQRASLHEIGAIEFEVTAPNNTAERFTIVAARGGDDIWLEVRRHPAAVEEPVAVSEGGAVAAAVPGVEEQPAPADHAVEEAAAEPTPPVAEEETVYVVDAHYEAVSEAADPSTQEVLVIAEVQPEIAANVAATPVPRSVEEAVVDMDETPAESVHTIQAEDDLALAENDLMSEDELLTAEWGDDVMTEGDLGELLRASAATIIRGESTIGPEPFAVDRQPTSFEQPISLAADTQADADVPALSIDELDADISLADAIKAIDDTEFDDQTELAKDPAVAAREALLAEQEELWASHVHLVTSSDMVEDVDAIEKIGEPVIAAAAVPAPFAVAEEFDLLHAEDAHQIEDAVGMRDRFEAAADEAGSVRAEEDSEIVVAMNEEENDVQDEPAPSRPVGVVVPLTRQPRTEATAGQDLRGGVGTMERILRLAAARGAATVYVNAQSAPMVRVDGEFSALEGEPTVSAAAVERLTAELAPPGRDTTAATSEWVIDVSEIGRVRCLAFRDYRGPGLIFRMVPQRAISADSLALPAEVQALCSEADGLVLVAGGRGSGKSTLLTSFVDLINRTRSDHVITAESEIEFLHENKRSFISQREIRGDADAVVAAVRAACREDPDVLIVEDLRSADLVSLALDAAQSGRLVFASMPAPSAVSAIERIIEMFPPERREKAQALLAGTLRGVVSQVLLRKLRGGRVAAREVLLNTSTVANLILEGKAFQLPAAIESGRRHGMMPLAESLATLVREGVVHPSHAYRKAPNREQFLSILRRDGTDTAIAERLA